jgi:signal transduction histidine kinase
MVSTLPAANNNVSAAENYPFNTLAIRKLFVPWGISTAKTIVTKDPTENPVDPISLDVALVQRIPVLSTILEVITTTTGMGFAAVARVTQEKWVACGVRDEIQFGLKPGGELLLESTICNEIRDSLKPVIIDHVKEDPEFCNHHTPRQYGFQSYISIPIFLKNDGSFFGTLCAIDPRPAQLKNPRIIGMFNLFADLIAFHIAALQEMDRTQAMLRDTDMQLRGYQEEIRQYQHISNHNLQEPLRKLRLFSDILLSANARGDRDKVEFSALRINEFARGFSTMIQQLSDFSSLSLRSARTDFEITDLNVILADIVSRLSLMLKEKNATIDCGILHTIPAIPGQMSRLFYHLINNAIIYAKKDISPFIKVYSHDLTPEAVEKYAALLPGRRYCEICFIDNGIGIEAIQVEKIFDIFTHSSLKATESGVGMGLAQCRKIVSNHHGQITVHSELGQGATFSVILPLGS